MRKLLSILLVLLSLAQVNAQDVFSSFTELCPEASMTFCLKDVQTGKTEVSYDARRSLAPASVMKLLTTIACLDKYGASYSFETPIAYTGSIKDGVLKGSLVIKASGDPSWNSRYFPGNDVFDKIIFLLKSKGIKKISWGLIIDEGNEDYSVPRTWMWEDIANYYGSPVNAINLYDNTYRLDFSSTKAGRLTKIKSVTPKMNNIHFINEVVASKVNKDDAWIFGGPSSSQRIIKGSIPSNRKSFIVKGSISKTNQLFLEHLRARLTQENILCKNKILVKKISTYTSLGDVYWPNLHDMVYYTNQKSVNLFAEALVNKVGSLCTYYSQKGLDVSGVSLYDGSGISRFNMLNSEFLTDVLLYAHKQEYIDTLLESLPKAGKTGTLKRFGKGSCLENNLIAKTGSMKSVRAYAGYITIAGKKKAFSCIVNNYTCTNKEMTNIIEEILVSLCI